MPSTSSANRGASQPIPSFTLLVVAVVLVLSACGSMGAGPTAGMPGGSGRFPATPSAPMGSIDPGATAPAAPSAMSSMEPGSTEPATPGPTLARVPPLQPPAYASRVVVEDLAIDLPVISGDLQPPPSYPLCDVAAYVTRFNQPYETGVTYISAHAQRGMFAPLLSASERADGAELLGMQVQVFVSDGRRFDYVVDRVVRHAVDYAVLAELSLGEQLLVLQTSEGPYGTAEKLQVVATFEAETTVDPALAAPEPKPRDCRPDEPASPAP